MFIERSMTRKVVTIGPEAGLLEAREAMKTHGIPSLPVVGEDGVLLGIVTDRDLRSALPSGLLAPEEARKEHERIAVVRVKDLMTRDPVTVAPVHTLQDALILILRAHVGTLPVVDEHRRVIGIISLRDMLQAFEEVLGLNEPGTLLCVLADERPGQMKRIVDTVTEEGIRLGSVLVARDWERGKRAFFPYLFTNNTIRIKRRLEALGFTLLNPLDWYLKPFRAGP